MSLGGDPPGPDRRSNLHETDPNFYSASILGSKEEFIRELNWAKHRNLTYPRAIAIDMETGEIFAGNDHAEMNREHPIVKESYCKGIAHFDLKNAEVRISHLFDMRGERGRELKDPEIQSAMEQVLTRWLAELGKPEAWG